MYCIYNKARRLYCRWNEKVIVFDTTDQAYEFMNLVPAFFAGEHNYVCIIPTNSEMDEDIENNADSILRYTDLTAERLQRENKEIIGQQIENEYMKEVLKNG